MLPASTRAEQWFTVDYGAILWLLSNKQEDNRRRTPWNEYICEDKTLETSDAWRQAPSAIVWPVKGATTETTLQLSSVVLNTVTCLLLLIILMIFNAQLSILCSFKQSSTWISCLHFTIVKQTLTESDTEPMWSCSHGIQKGINTDSHHRYGFHLFIFCVSWLCSTDLYQTWMSVPVFILTVMRSVWRKSSLFGNCFLEASAVPAPLIQYWSTGDCPIICTYTHTHMHMENTWTVQAPNSSSWIQTWNVYLVSALQLYKSSMTQALHIQMDKWWFHSAIKYKTECQRTRYSLKGNLSKLHHPFSVTGKMYRKMGLKYRGVVLTHHTHTVSWEHHILVPSILIIYYFKSFEYIKNCLWSVSFMKCGIPRSWTIHEQFMIIWLGSTSLSHIIISPQSCAKDLSEIVMRKS